MIIKKYNIKQSFYERYFKELVNSRYGMELLSFMYYRKGNFLNPMKKNETLKQYMQEEIENFYEKKQISIPLLEFGVTTKCTLKCKDCCALIPPFNKREHFNLTFESFKRQLDKVCDSVNMVWHLVLLGGEPLINPELPQMIDYACKKDNIHIVRITTNGTMLPSEKLLSVLKENPNRAYFYMSNYGANKDLLPLLKYEELKNKLKEVNIKFEMVDSWNWLAEEGVAKEPFSNDITTKKVLGCYRSKCTQILNGKLDICSKALGARELGLIKSDEYIDIEKSTNLKQDLIDFYQRDYADACRYCILSEETVQPALQLE